MSSGLLAGRRVVVVGGASGIGLATVQAVSAVGGAVAVLDRDGDGASAAAAGARASGVPASAHAVDITDEDQVAQAIDDAAAELGGIDAMLHIAGVMAGQGLDIREVSPQLWAKVIAVNLTGPFVVAKHAARHMIPAGDGVMVFVASRAGVVSGSGSIPYGASKGGLHGLSLTLARQLRPYGIRVNTLCPGDIDTPLMRRSLDEALANGIDSGRLDDVRAGLGRPEHVARLLAMVASPAADGLDGIVFSG